METEAAAAPAAEESKPAQLALNVVHTRSDIEKWFEKYKRDVLSAGASGSGAGEENQDDGDDDMDASASASEGGTGAGAGAGKQGGHVTASGRVISEERWRALFGSDTSSSDGDSDGNDGCIVGDGCGAGGSGNEAEVQLLNPFGNDGPPLVAKGDFNEEAKKVVVYSTLDCCICMCISIVILLVCLPRLSARRGREGLRSEA